MENRRLPRNYFPEPKFQMRFLKVLVFGALVELALISAILYHFLKENYTLLVKYAALEAPVSETLYLELRILMATIGGTFLIYLVILTLLGIRFSHQVVGVMVALKRTIAEINDGKQASLSFRPSDEFQDLQDSFNAMVKKLSEGRKST